MRSLLARVPLWVPVSLMGLGTGLPGGTGLQTAVAQPAAAPAPAAAPKPAPPKPAAAAAKPAAAAAKPAQPAAPSFATTMVHAGEDCAAVARRMYGVTVGSQPGVLARLQAANPGLCAKPLVPGTRVRMPALGKKPAPEPPRLSYVGPAVRTKTRSGWMEALPGQPIDRRMSIETSNVGGAEVDVQDKVKLQLDPNSKMVIKNLPRSGRAGGEVQLVEGTLRAGVAEDPKSAPLTVRTKSAEIKLKGGARIDAAGDTRTALSVHEGSVSLKVKGTVLNIRAGQGTLILQGQVVQQPKDLPTAPVWSPNGFSEAAAPGSGKPFVVVAASSLNAENLKGEVEVDFAPVAGASRYVVEIARDPSFNDRRAGGEVETPPLRAQLQPGRYYARVSAIDSERLVGPPSPVRSFYVITLRTDASVVGVPVQNGEPSGPDGHGAQMMLVRSLEATLQLSGVGQALQATIDNGPPIDCRNEHTFTLGPGEHHVRLSLGDAESDLLFSVAPPPPPPVMTEIDAHVELLETPVPLVTAGFPGRTLQPRSRVYALFGLGSSLASRDLNIGRLDIGGELAILQRRLSFDVNIPLLYYTGLQDRGLVPDDNAAAIGDISVGARAVALKALSGRLLFGPLLRLQFPTGSFDRTPTLGRPITIDTALGVAAQLGRFGLQVTQGLPGTFNITPSQLRWASSYSAQVKVWKLSLVAALEAAVGLVGDSNSGASLGGGVRLQLGPWNLLTGVRGGLGDSGAAIFGRYYYFFGAEWAPQ